MSFYTFAKKYGNSILYRGIEDNNGSFRRVTKKIKQEEYSPSLFVKDANGEYKSIFNERLRRIKFDSIKDAKSFISDMEDCQDVYGMQRFEYAFLSDTFKDKIVADTSKIRIFFVDIETWIGTEGFESPATARQPITAITIYDTFTKQFHSFTYKEKSKAPKQKDNYVLEFFNDEVSMLRSFIAFWKMNYCDIVSGWNSDFYDVPYLVKRIQRVLDEKAANDLSPFGVVNERTVEVFDRPQLKINIMGISSIDYLDVFKKFTYSVQESYKLDHIAHVFLKENKIDYSKDYNNLNDLYERNYDMFMEYNVRDVELLVKLDANLQFFNIIFELAYLAKCNYEDTLGTVKIWDVYIYNRVREKGLVIPPEQISKKDGTFAGAFVKDPLRGRHEWVVTFDAASLYPSLIRQYNMSPETLIPKQSHIRANSNINLYNIDMNSLVNKEYDFSYFKEKNVGITASGALFDNRVSGILPAIVADVIDGRKIAKTEMLQKERELELLEEELKRRNLS